MADREQSLNVIDGFAGPGRYRGGEEGSPLLMIDAFVYVVAGGAVLDAAALLGIRPSTVKRHLVDLRARSGLTTEQLTYAGRGRWLARCTESGGQLSNAVAARPTRPGVLADLDSIADAGALPRPM